MAGSRVRSRRVPRGEPPAERYVAPGLSCPYCADHAALAYKRPRAPLKMAHLEAQETARSELIKIAAGTAPSASACAQREAIAA